jgi:hypothetical protein
MKYYLDCEFNEYKGHLISMALIREDDVFLYLVKEKCPPATEWVKENVLPILFSSHIKAIVTNDWSSHIEKFLKGDNYPIIISDWPDDIKYFCEEIITGPGTMIDIPGIQFVVERVDAYPTDLFFAKQHNAYWDAKALKYKLQKGVYW